MQQKPRTIRKPLKDLMGEIVDIQGFVKEIKSNGDDGYLDVLLINAKLTHLAPDKTVPQCQKWHIDHVWIKHQLEPEEVLSLENGRKAKDPRFQAMGHYEKVLFQGTPYRYVRKDGSIDYGIRIWPQVDVPTYWKIQQGKPKDGNWKAYAEFLEDIVTRASKNQLRLNTLEQTHNETLSVVKKFLRHARVNSKAVNKAPRGKKPKVPTFAQLFKTKT